MAITISNNESKSVKVSINKWGKSGNVDWYTVAAEKSADWGREDHKGYSMLVDGKGEYLVGIGKVTFEKGKIYNNDEEIHSIPVANDKSGKVIVVNNTSDVIEVAISLWGDIGDGSYFNVQPGKLGSWDRKSTYSHGLAMCLKSNGSSEKEHFLVGEGVVIYEGEGLIKTNGVEQHKTHVINA